MTGKKGKFIALEGIDGAGKSTHLSWIADHLTRQGISVTATREPGGTPIAERLRTILLDGSEVMTPLAELLIMFAARAVFSRCVWTQNMKHLFKNLENIPKPPRG